MKKKLKYSELEAKVIEYEKIISDAAIIIKKQAETIKFIAKQVEEL